MESYEINMLEVIQQHEYISQRDLSHEVGISLGMVNLLLKKFAKTGLVKMERLNGNKVKYMLTPSGFAYLSKKTVDYIARSYQAVLKIQQHMLSVLREHYSLEDTVVICGPRDDVGMLLEDLLKAHGYTYRWVDKPPTGEPFLQWQDSAAEGIFILKWV